MFKINNSYSPLFHNSCRGFSSILVVKNHDKNYGVEEIPLEEFKYSIISSK
jgi:hypothetical protein